ncbi:reverse transcriptase domain-containing protein [Tanacetum coccineum]
MQTRSSSKFVGEPSTNPTSTNPKCRNRRRSKQRVEPFALEETPVVTMADQRTMAELLRAPTEGYAEAIVVPPIPAEHFELKHSLINLVTSKQFFSFEKEDPHAHIRYFNKITSSLKYKDVPETSIKLMLFPFSINGPARIWLDKEPSRSILTWDDLVSKFINHFFPPSKTTNLRNEISNFQQKFEETFSEAWDHFKDLLRACPHHGFTELHQLDTFYNGLNPSDQDSLNYVTGGNLLERNAQDVLKIIENKSKVRNSRNKPIVSQVKASNVDSSEIASAVASAVTSAMTAMFKQHQVTPAPASVKAMSSFFQMNTASSSGSGSLPSNTVANPRGDLKAITTRSGISYDGPPIPPLPKVVEREPEVTKDTVQPSTENIQPPVVQIQAPFDEPVVAPKPKPSIPYPSRANKQKLREKDDNLASKFVEIFRELHFELSFADALLHMPKFASMFKSLLNNKEKLFDLAKTPVNENCSAVILKKLPEKLGDPDKFLIPCDFQGMVECLALADLEITLRFNDEAITFKVGQTLRYSYNNSESVNRIDVIDVSCEEYAQEVLGFSDSSKSGNPTPSLDPILSNYSPSLTPFEGGDFILEEIEACLTNDSIPFGNDDAVLIQRGPSLSRSYLIDDPHPLPPKELHFEELKTIKSSIDDPPELELKDLPSHLEYAFLEGTDKLPVIISKELKDEEKAALLKVLKSHKRAIAWKISDIKGIDPSFCTHKILMEDDFKPAIQHQRRVNPKIHEVIKKEVIKLLDAGLIYPISDSPWVSPVHCVPKKGGMTVVENEDNELIPTRLVTGWRVCIDYRKLNDATRKDHFPLPFMDQMLERLAGNEYYCFLDGFSGYFQIPIDPQDQEKTTFTCPYGTFAYRRMPFGLCNAPGTFQRCMMAIFHDMIEETMEVFMDDFSVKEGIVLGHKISKSGIEVDKAKVDVIAKLPHPTFIKAFNILKKKLTEALILVAPDWDLPFKIMCDASDYAVGAVLGQRDLEKKEINETFPLETLEMISFRVDSSTSWFADIANYHAGNFINKRKNSLRMLSIIFGMTAKKPLISSQLAIMDPPGDIMVPTTPLRKSLIPVSIGRLFTVMPMTWSHGVTLVNVKAKSRKKIKCLKMQFKYKRSLTYEASTLWARSRLLEGTSTFS